MRDDVSATASDQPGISRRRFVAGALGLSASAAALAACGGGDDRGASQGGQATTAAGPSTMGAMSTAAGSPAASASGPGASGSGSGAGPLTPAYVPFSGAKPDIAGGDHGIPAVYYHYPSAPKAFIEHPLGSGEKIDLLLESSKTIPPLDHNKWHQAINSAVNATINVQTVPSTDYLPKFQTLMASGDLPDMMQVVGVPDLPQVLDKEFTDLTEYLSGDAIKEYPGLASTPTPTWLIPTVNGRIWGITQPRPPDGSVGTTRGDVLKEAGFDSSSPDLSSGADFIDLCKRLTDPKKHRYALGQQPNTFILNAFLEMMEAPNGWTVDGGKFISQNESDQMKDALDQVRQIWSAGYIHPDSFLHPGNSITWWNGGTVPISYTDIVNWHYRADPHPEWDLGGIMPPKWGGGGKAKKRLGVAGYGAFVGLKKAKPDRVRTLLRILDFFCAPFGTKEFLTFNYGAAGVDYTLNGSDPVPTETASVESTGAIQYCGSQLYTVIYESKLPDLAKAEHSYLQQSLPDGIADPSWGLYSATASTKGATADKNLQNATSDIIQGRKSMSDWDGAVKAWKEAAGDATASEYEAAYAAQNGG